MSNDILSIGWCHALTEGSAVFDPPRLFAIGKDPSESKRGYLSCPAVRSTCTGLLEVAAPFSLRLSFEAKGGAYMLTPIYPQTSIQPARLRDLIILEPSDTWPSKRRPVLQIPSPYLFVSDVHVEMEQLHPFLAPTTQLNWRLIPGRFNIFGWQRPLNWAIEWDVDAGDLVIKAGEPLYFLRFYDEEGRSLKEINLLQIEFSRELADRVSMTAGVTSIRRGMVPVMERAAQTRSKKLVIKK